ncbi:uncharacterized protein LOC131165618 isoform X2 [Malania oleifera]|uniref:uncharacterized protein LOC131165618 isoform X2 n=1 Tax=Malania oleifera TaxID=397392 RepID=UPI0025ADA6F5|nr:uncharacterized protein LOC131165618 isoform X2 [Malania oleifera]
MPPEPLPWDRKELYKERKQERSESASLGSVARWREPPLHHGPRDFVRWGSVDFRRPYGHSKQGGWHLFSEESGHGYMQSRSGDKMLEEESFRSSMSRGDGKYSRNSRENRGGLLSQNEWKGHSWETTVTSPNAAGRQLDVNDQRSVDDMLGYTSHPHSDFGNTWDQLHFKDQHDKTGAINGLGTGQRYDRENSLGSNWRPLKWIRSGSLSSRGSGFSHSSSSKSIGVDSQEAKVDMQPRSVTPVQSPSGDALPCATCVAPLEEASSRKKQRLGWGEGLAKYEKKKVEGLDESANKNAESLHSLGSSFAEKSPRVTGFSDCASPATPSSVACSSSPGLEDKLFVKGVSVGNDTSNLSGSPDPVSQPRPEHFPINLENLELNTIANLSSSLIEMLQPDDQSSVDSSFVRSTAMNKLLIWKGGILKALEVTESEIDQLENELKSLKSESRTICPCPEASSYLPAEGSTKSCDERVATSNMISTPTPLLISSGDIGVEKIDDCNGALEEAHAEIKDDDVDSPGTATSKFVEQLPLKNATSPYDTVNNTECSRGLGVTGLEAEVKCTVSHCMDQRIDISVCEDANKFTDSISAAPNSCDVGICTDGEDALCDILTYNKNIATSSSEIFNKLFPKDHSQFNISEASNAQNESLIKEKFAMRKRFLRFKERVITLKFRAFLHLWKEDMRLLSIRKYRAKSQKKFELSSRTSQSGYQKYRSSIRSRFYSPDSQVKLHRNTLKMPALILDKKEKMVSRFISSNGLVEDPCAVEKERVMINPWTPEEKEIFMDKLATFGKDFRKIASFLDHKTTADCIEFYYKNHKSDFFEKTRKKLECRKQRKSLPTNTYLVTSGKKWNRESNAASLDVLGAASVFAAHADENTDYRQSCSERLVAGRFSDYKMSRGDDDSSEKCSNFDTIVNDRETVAADVLAGICGSLSSEAMSSCITSSVDPGESYQEWKCQKVGAVTKRPLTPEVTCVDDETCSDESCGEMDSSDWTDDEKSIFIQAMSSYGKDFAMISQCVRTKSRDQCKVFFSKARKCLGLDLAHPVGGNGGTPSSNDGSGGGSDTDDACVVETGSAICSSKLDVDLPRYVLCINHEESVPGGRMDLQTDLNSSVEKSCPEKVNLQDAVAIEKFVPDECQAEDEPNQILDGNIENGGVSESVPLLVQQNAILSDDVEARRNEVIGQCDSGVESPLAEEAVGSTPSGLNAVLETESLVADVSVKGLGNESEGEKFLLLKNSVDDGQDENKKCDADTSGQTGLYSPSQNLDAAEDTSHLAVKSSSSGFNFDPECQLIVSSELDHTHKPPVVSLQRGTSLLTENSVSHDPVTVHYERINQDLSSSSSTFDFEEMGEKLCKMSFAVDGHQHHTSEHPSVSHVESSHILGGYPFPLPMKKEVTEDLGATRSSAFQGSLKVDGNFQSGYLGQDCGYLHRCSSVKDQSSAAELQLLSQNLEHSGDHSRAHAQSSSDAEKPSRNGDVKLFGQILSHPSSLQKTNASTQDTDDKVVHHQPKAISKPFNLKFNGHHNVEGSSIPSRIDRNNYLCLENLPMSYGFWDGNRIQTGFSALPDSSILLAKYPAAFGSYPASVSKMEQQQQPLQALVKGTEHNLNGVTVFPTREMSSSNGVADFQMYRSRDGTKVPPPFAVDLKEKQEIYPEVQRRKGFEAVSSLQQQTMGGMVGMNVLGRGGGILVGAGTGVSVSDPVAAIKMHYANKTDQYSGQVQVGSGMREEESWRGKNVGDIGSR